MDTASAIFLTLHHSSKTQSSYNTHTDSYTQHNTTQHNNSNHINADRKSEPILPLRNETQNWRDFGAHYRLW